jgi:hypothetical protein
MKGAPAVHQRNKTLPKFVTLDMAIARDTSARRKRQPKKALRFARSFRSAV